MLKVKMNPDRKMNVIDMEDGQLFECEGNIGVKVAHGWIILDEDEMIPFIWEELDKDENDPYHDCTLLDGTLNVEVKLA